MVFEEIRSGGCVSYLVGCPETCSGVLIDPQLGQIDRALGLAAKAGIRVQHVIDTHTHADHFSAAREIGRRLGIPVVMFRGSPAPYVDVRVDDGESIIAGRLRLRVLHTPGTPRIRSASCCKIACSRATRSSAVPPGAPTCRRGIPRRSTRASSGSS
jgi:hypothetical protein